jgi:hypothetical protein
VYTHTHTLTTWIGLQLAANAAATLTITFLSRSLLVSKEVSFDMIHIQSSAATLPVKFFKYVSFGLEVGLFCSLSRSLLVSK